MLPGTTVGRATPLDPDPDPDPSVRLGHRNASPANSSLDRFAPKRRPPVIAGHPAAADNRKAGDAAAADTLHLPGFLSPAAEGRDDDLQPSDQGLTSRE